MSASEPMVPLQDPSREYLALKGELDAAVRRVARSGRYVMGPEVEAFEDELAGYVGTRHALGVGSGTDALLLALRALGVGPGDEVITSPFSFFATAEAIVHAGAKPVFADIEPETFALDPEAADAAVTPRTAAILPVHLYGQMADTEALGAVAERHDLALVEDAAQALGAAREPGASDDEAGDRDDTRTRAGAAGDAGCFSFYPTKNLGGWGDGGMITTDDDDVAARVRRLRDHGQGEGRYRHAEIGYNSRLDALHAAVLSVKLRALDGWNELRRQHAAAYDGQLADVEGVRPPAVRPGNLHIYHQYTMRCRDRDAVSAGLRERGIGHAIYYPVPLHLQEPLAVAGHAVGDFPEAERAAREVLSLPVFPGLTPEERNRVVAALKGIAASASSLD